MSALLLKHIILLAREGGGRRTRIIGLTECVCVDAWQEEISDEEKLQIAQHYLLNAPPGQFTAVLEGVHPPVTRMCVEGWMESVLRLK